MNTKIVCSSSELESESRQIIVPLQLPDKEATNVSYPRRFTFIFQSILQTKTIMRYCRKDVSSFIIIFRNIDKKIIVDVTGKKIVESFFFTTCDK